MERTVADVYRDEQYVTLYRYEKPTEAYDERREGDVSKRDLVGTWFTSNLGDLSAYINTRKPGGNIVTVRVPKQDINGYDASKLDATKEMDIEPGNYIVPKEVGQYSRLEIPLLVKPSAPYKFTFKDWGKVRDFVASSLTPENLIRLATTNTQARHVPTAAIR